ncbi:tRNA (adenosine(37)-N6)-threonylcarbamoyltransferase complex ATPase subunit type 1 TsaE [Alkalibacter mobilis]|uniref:tRNA (adenosine(37)-N6)-threonylcarbamoyltransferase complex ATPase subunit type 1 TsaE n=1 Tax=Alkalibacter mobilis TaxID=2787712 RepID=UPI00189EFCD3|nr:tRNA (adenosine(37)-N6)-threonylcarbamoyltransferase complex ATPase subunit type 1 TsaE [Alkalibacter mobilis]MBF7096599.1 tRNA (adenosine(37)-N6)-threonylcarbamoyltransferase complex ATPase subunit type 1 TsaE [Alkalibacter mobilis]
MKICSKVVKTVSAEETQYIGKQLGEMLKSGCIVCLDGEMGAGKTAMSQGLLRGLGVEGYITSPTYSLVNEYETKDNNVKIFHFDVYRLESIDDLYDIGFEEYLKDSILIIEWASIIRSELNGNIIDIYLEKGDKIDERNIKISGPCDFIQKIDSIKGEF